MSHASLNQKEEALRSLIQDSCKHSFDERRRTCDLDEVRAYHRQVGKKLVFGAANALAYPRGIHSVVAEGYPGPGIDL